eukprot:TRINITY_DN69407_c0_g1_i1.p1 TRINITY_DN69407_c0_g1~~TRINITY_DN69407_c0_g1_i1.p1  ORF type:complete len:1073 (+),score=153.34 TRINITY_DN69407_c0_g1_i1:162-3380(+)
MTRSSGSEAQAVEDYARDRQLMEALDAKTEVPHLLVELRSLGYIEICGKNIGGVYDRLSEWLDEKWNCEPATWELRKSPDYAAFNSDFEAPGLRFYGWDQQSVGLQEHDRLCDYSWHWEYNTAKCFCACCGLYRKTVFKQRGQYGENNMGKLTMQLINFMTNTCGWGLKLCNGTNLGFHGQIREQQIKFKAPHPLNLIAPHLMIELRQAGWIEINGANTNGIYEKLGVWLAETWKAKKAKADAEYCDLKFSTKVFKKRGTEGENNMGQRTMEIVDFMVQKCSWTMITCNGGNYGRYGDIREQQLVFRDDAHVQHGEDHIMVELRDIGYIEVNGLSSSPDIAKPVDEYLTKCWDCTVYKPGMFESAEKYCDKKYKTPSGLYYKDNLTNNIGKLTIELSIFMASQGWMLQLCNGGHTSSLKSVVNTVVHEPGFGSQMYEMEGYLKREQQIKFTKGRPGEDVEAPLLMIEMRMIPGNAPRITAPKPGFGTSKHEVNREKNENSKSILKWLSTAKFEGLIEVNGLNTNGVYQKLGAFLSTYMKGTKEGPTPYCDCLFRCPPGVFRGKLAAEANEFWDGYYCGENNLGKFTMRLCDFMVDHLGEWDLIVCNGNSAERAWMFGGMTSIAAREQQLVFRHRKEKRARVFMAASNENAPLGHPPLDPPIYWKDGAKDGRTGHDVVPATEEELRWMQELLDGTYVNKVTRDRRGGSLAKKFVVVAAVRSEHPKLWHDFAKRRTLLAQRRGSVGKADEPRLLCTKGCGRCAAPGLDRNGKPYVTCCRGCAVQGIHDASCTGDQAATASSAEGEFITTKTRAACAGLDARCSERGTEGVCVDPGVAGPGANEVHLMHGTNPTSAVAILRTDFKIDLAGSSAGTMFGPGAYLAEASTKADEYAQADKDGAYAGMFAMVVCRAVLGKSFVQLKPGNNSARVTSGEFDSICGDREKAVGTFRELIFFHEQSIYPEYAVFYRREDGAADVEGGASTKTVEPTTLGAPEPADALPGEDTRDYLLEPSMPQGVMGHRKDEHQVRLPFNLKQGTPLTFQAADGQHIEIQVPPGSRPGSILTVRVGQATDI